MTTITGTGTIIYLRDTGGGNLQYQVGGIGGSWSSLTFPVSLQNTSPSASSVLTLQLYTDITITNAIEYFGTLSSYISIEGSDHTITVANVPNYAGFFENGVDNTGTSSFDNITISNVSITTTGSSSLPTGSGWLCRPYFSYGKTGCTLTNCSSTGAISQSSGGLIGKYAQNMTAIKCFSIGAIGDNTNSPGAGGIFSYNCRSCTATNCFSIGVIGINCGGIFGSYSDLCNTGDCYSIGSIAQNAGGIYGNSANTCSASACYSNGEIGSGGDVGAGGIYGSSGADSTASNCYSSGSIGTNGGGIFGASATTNTITHCYSAGTQAAGAGGFVGAASSSNTVLNSIASNSMWSDSSALSSLLSIMPNSQTTLSGKWISTSLNQPYLLVSFNTNFYNGITSSTITTGGSDTTSLTTTGTGSTYSLVNSASGDVNINSSSGQMTYTGASQTNSYTLIVMNYNTSGGGSYWGYNLINFTLNIDVPTCYLEGTQILCYSKGYIPIQDIKPGMLVKTYKHGYKKVIAIEKCLISKKQGQTSTPSNRLYVLKRDVNNHLFADLYITGMHSILVSRIPTYKKAIAFYGENNPKDMKIEDKYLLPAVINDKCRLVEADELGTPGNYHQVYHVVLEHVNRYRNYGIWANGILSESLSIHNYQALQEKRKIKN